MPRKAPKSDPPLEYDSAVMASRLELWPLDRLRPYKGNAKQHPRDQVEKIARSIETYGFNSPILVDGEGGIVAGHGRLLAAQLLKLEQVPVIVLDHLTEKSRRAYLLLDNRLADLGPWDLKALERELGELPDMDLDTMGFSESELADLVAEVEAATPEQKRQPKPAPEAGPAPKKPTTELGDLWNLGDHRLLCGDSTDEETVELATDGLVDAVVTDPPYAIYGSSTGVSSSVADDRMVRPTFEGILRMIAAHLKPFGHAYTFCDWRSWPAWKDVSRNTGLLAKNLLVWVKPGGGLGSMYANGYELIGFWHREDERTGVFKGKAVGARMVHRCNVLHFGRAGSKGDVGAKGEHNAQKPVDLLEELIENSTDRGELILDTYAGSGSVMLACERKGRRSTSLEIEPKWVDVAIVRWQTMTGKKARLGKKSGKTFAAVTKERRGR